MAPDASSTAHPSGDTGGGGGTELDGVFAGLGLAQYCSPQHTKASVVSLPPPPPTAVVMQAATNRSVEASDYKRCDITVKRVIALLAPALW